MRQRLFYILEGKRPVVVDGVQEWAAWFEFAANRRVAEHEVGPSKVSTVFLGLDHGFGDSQPILWETMVFGGPMDQHQDRCAGSWEQAEAMHAQVLELVRRSTDGKVRKRQGRHIR